MVGAVFGIAGTFAAPPLRGLLWGIDGIALVVASAMLAIHYLRKGDDTAAAGFLAFLAGETLISNEMAKRIAEMIKIFIVRAKERLET